MSPAVVDSSKSVGDSGLLQHLRGAAAKLDDEVLASLMRKKGARMTTRPDAARKPTSVAFRFGLGGATNAQAAARALAQKLELAGDASKPQK